MKKMKLTLVLLIVTFAVAFCQPDKVFKEQITVEKGIKFGDGTIQLTAPTNGVADWNTMINKPSVFNPDLTKTNPLYKSIAWVPSWNDVTGKPVFSIVATSGSYLDLKDKPAELELDVAISQLKGIDFPVLTQTEINALPVPVKKGKVVINSTANVMQWFDGTTWKIFPTTN